MAAYKVKIFPAAEQDLEELVAYLNTLSHEAAIRYFDKLTEEISSFLRCLSAARARGIWPWLRRVTAI